MNETTQPKSARLRALATVGAVLGAATAFVGGSGTAAFATASATAYNFTSGVLYENPYSAHLSAPTCFHRSIKLDQGTYLWFQDDANTGDGAKRNITLKEGEYTWQVCLSTNYWINNGDWYYGMQSSLIPSSGATATLSSTFTVGSNGTYEWGDSLTPLG